MNKLLLKTATASAVALALGLASPAFANDTSSAIRGKITDPLGNAATGTVITITHVPSGTTKTTTVNDAGFFSTKGLRVGGPYSITIDSNTLEDTQIDDVFLSLGDVYPLDVTLRSSQDVEVISVSGRVINALSGSTGPGNNFTLTDIEDAPSISRDIKDVVRIDPRISINESGGNAIQCAGGNPRFNSLTVDGARMNDNFGLNSNGYPTTRMPFSFDSIGEISVELAPFDVQYGGFTSCNINAVTKSGNNEIEGGLFYDYTSDSLKGDSLEGDNIPTGDFTEKNYGFHIGGAIIEDKLQFFVSYEKLDGAQIFQYTPFNNGRISQSTIDRIRNISINKYAYDPGTMIPSKPVEDEKLLLKLDWNINENHRANFVYNYNDGFELSQSDAGSSRLSLSNHFYERGSELKSYVASLYSEWNDSFSTEMRIGYSELDNRQISLDQTSGFGEIRIDTGDVDVYIGPDDSRQSNKLKYDNLSFKFAGTYYLDEHEIYFGYEYESLDVFNLFVQHSQTETRFGSIDDFETGTNARIYYGNASSHNPNDAAGEFKYALNTLYLQDTYTLYDYDLTLTYGLRYDWYSSNDVPAYNKKFEDRYGFSNQQNLDGISLLQPRFGFNWEASDQLEIRGGVGLYSGGNPNVWISNSYSTDGVRNIQEDDRGFQVLGADAIKFNGSGRPGYDIPQVLFDKVGQGNTDDSTNVTDPNFDIPSEWKYSLGATYTTENDYVLMADILLSRKQDSAIIKNLADGKVATAPDGRPVYSSVNHSRKSDFLLTNVKGRDAKSTVISFSLNKTYDNGIKLTASYAYSDVKDVHPMTSSVAFSNYHNIAVVDPENPVLSTSNYEIPHRFTMSLNYSHEFFDGYQTKFGVFGQANEGRPYTYSFDRSSRGLGFNDSSRQLLYIPLVNDPNVVYGTYKDENGNTQNFQLDEFNKFIESEGLTRGQIMGRNTLKSDWWVKFDLKIEQEFAGFSPDHKASAFFVIKNVGNLLNDDWGVLKQGSFLQGAVTATVTDDNKYSFNKFNNPSPQSRVTDPSLWEMKLGVKYKF